MTTAAVRRPGWVAKTAALAGKDLRIETRARDTLPPMLAFSVTVALLLAFTLPATGDLEAPVDIPPAGTASLAAVLAGFLWVTILFSGLIGFARSFEVEQRDGALDSLLLVPLDRSGLFAAKAIANLATLIVVEIVLIPVFGLLFGIDLAGSLGPLAAVIVLADIGFVALGTLFASLAAQTRSRELMLPVLALPAVVPVFIAATELTADLLVGSGLSGVVDRGWFGVLVAVDVIYVTVAALAFEFTLD
jgi:heme exporter protein B